MHSDTHWHTDRHAGNKVASENESWKWEQACSCEVRSDRRGWRPMTVSFRTSVPDCCVSAAHIRCWAGLRFFREGYKCIYTSSILQLEKKLLGANRFFLSPLALSAPLQSKRLHLVRERPSRARPELSCSSFPFQHHRPTPLVSVAL